MKCLARFTMLCSSPSFRRKPESRPAVPPRWMPDQVRHDKSLMTWLQPIVNGSVDLSKATPIGFKEVFCLVGALLFLLRPLTLLFSPLALLVGPLAFLVG